MKAFLVYDDNGYDAIGNAYVVAAENEDNVKIAISNRWGISRNDVDRNWSVEPINGVKVNPEIITTTFLVD